MIQVDKYSNIAETYDYTLFKNPEREKFFMKIFKQNNVNTVLDCACGAGKDLILFNSLGFDTVGSDISDSMLSVAQKRINENGLRIQLYKADYQFLQSIFSKSFDAIVCLSNAINEIDVDVLKALNSMQTVLNDKGIIIFDQGQTDSSMQNPIKYSVEVNNRDFSRLYTMDYHKNIMTVNVFDLIHTDGQNDFKRNEFKVKIRLYDEWMKILNKANLQGDSYGYWDFGPYNKISSQRLIIVARKKV